MINTPYVRIIEYKIDPDTYDRETIFTGIFSMHRIIENLRDKEVPDMDDHSFRYVNHICKDIVKYGEVLRGTSPKFSFGDTPDWWGFLGPDLEEGITIDPRDITDVEYEVG